MGTVLASRIISSAQTLLQDAAGTRWTTAELLGWLNEGQRVVVTEKPDAYVKTEAMRLGAGVKQTIPETGTVLQSVTRNMGAGGTSPGRSIQLVDRALMDAAVPDWAADTASATVQSYMFDDRNPRIFFVHPPQPQAGQGYVEIVYTAAPTDIAATDPIALGDAYEAALVNYVVYRAYAKDMDMGPNTQRATLAYQIFTQSLGTMQAQETSAEPVAKAASGPFVSVTRAG